MRVYLVRHIETKKALGACWCMSPYALWWYADELGGTPWDFEVQQVKGAGGFSFIGNIDDKVKVKIEMGETLYCELSSGSGRKWSPIPRSMPKPDARF